MSRDTREDVVRGLRSHKGFRCVVRVRDAGADRGFERACAAMGAAFDLSGRQLGKPAFDQVEPQRTGRRDVHVKARADPFRVFAAHVQQAIALTCTGRRTILAPLQVLTYGIVHSGPNRQCCVVRARRVHAISQ